MSAFRFTNGAILSLIFLFSDEAFSQKSSLPKWEAGINAGGYVYQGDLTPNRYGAIEAIRPGFGLSGTRIISGAFAARLLFNMAWLSCNESVYPYPAWRQQRNFSFTASVKELTLLLNWNVLSSNYDERKYEPYLFAGGGFSYVNVRKDFSRLNAGYFGDKSDVLTGLAVDAVAPPARLVPVFPVGAGLRYNLSDRLALNTELSYRVMHTDYLDGFSFSANPAFKDHYSSITVSLNYKFGNKERYGCPAVN